MERSAACAVLSAHPWGRSLYGFDRDAGHACFIGCSTIKQVAARTFCRPVRVAHSAAPHFRSWTGPLVYSSKRSSRYEGWLFAKMELG